jgi:hypothetical protein
VRGTARHLHWQWETETADVTQHMRQSKAGAGGKSGFESDTAHNV